MTVTNENSCRIVALEGDARQFALMTFTPWRPLLDNVAAPVRAIGAYVDGAPCGLALGGADAEAPCARLLSLFVWPTQRRQGIGRALIEALCDSFAGQAIWTRWSSELPQAAAFEALLAATGWSEKMLNVIQVSTTPRRALGYVNSRPRWRMVDRIGGYTWTLWADRSASDDDAIRAIIAGENVAEILDPFRYTQQYQVWTNSMLLRLKGAPVGWILTRQLEDVLLYDCHYVRAGLGRVGAILPMMAAMFRRQAEMLGPDSPVRYFVYARTPAMLALSRGSLSGAAPNERRTCSGGGSP